MEVRIGGKRIGDGHPCYVLAEIGINHNGDLDLARRLVDTAAVAGCDGVKFQKRTVDVVYSSEELDRPRETPWGSTNRVLKNRLELSRYEYDVIDRQCRAHGIDWLASCWDRDSVDFIFDNYCVPAAKIASASLTDLELIEHTCGMGRPLILSTGMSTLEEIDAAVGLVRACGNDFILLHCTSTYPAQTDELNLACIQTLKERYGVPVGYSGHEVGMATTLAAVAMGACLVERHITLDRSMFGSDQAASIEPHALMRLVRDIRTIEQARGDGEKRVFDSEFPIRDKLRRVPV